MRIAFFQGAGESGEPQANLRIARNRAMEAAGKGASLLVFPEMFVTGYNLGQAIANLAQPARGAYGQALAAAARESGVTIVAGYPELHGQTVYNAALVVTPENGVIASARKAHLFGALDRDAFSPADDLTIVRLKLDAPDSAPEAGRAASAGQTLNVGLCVCYDIEFPETARTLTLAGAQLILTPTAIMEPYDFVPRQVLPVRAWENGVFIAYVNRVGREGELVYCGQSVVVDPLGRELVRAERREEALHVVDLDLGLLQEAQRFNPYLADRRPTLYDRPVRVVNAPAEPSGPTGR